jgi:hypothetical protein
LEDSGREEGELIEADALGNSADKKAPAARLPGLRFFN